MPVAPTPRLIAPTRLDRLTTGALGALVRVGVGPFGARELQVRGRRSGALRTTVVNVLDLDGARYLVAPRGTTQWVKNLREAGTAGLRLGRRVETVRVAELEDAAKLPVLRAYLRRWGFEVGRFFPGIDANSPDAALAAVAADFPAFALLGRDSGARQGGGAAPTTRR